MKKRLRYLLLFFGGFVLLFYDLVPAQADCLGQLTGPIKVKVNQCQKIVPRTYFDQPGRVPAWFFDVVKTKEAIATLRSYEGLLIKGEVIESQAIDTAIGDKTALFGHNLTLLIQGDKASCDKLGKTGLVAGEVRKVCCDSGAQAPCFLKTSYLFQPYPANGKAAPVSPIATVAPMTDDLKKAHELFMQEKVNEAIPYFEKAAQRQALDPLSNYLLGLSYYVGAKDYEKAVNVLEKVRAHYNQLEGKQVKSYIKRSLLLLARSYALLKNADQAVSVLYIMLNDPETFREELNLAMRHTDFGWINSTHEYQNFLQKAQKAL